MELKDVAISPLSLPGGVRKALVFGGSFDPPHRGHVEVPLLARDRVLGEEAWAIFVPAARSPHKRSGPVASDADRLEMLRIALRGADRAVVWTDELDRAGSNEPSYTVDSLLRLRRSVGPGLQLRLLIGSDQAAAFHRWHRYREIIEAAAPVVVLRRPLESEATLVDALRSAGVWTEEELSRWRAWIAFVSPVDVNSTAVREALKRGREETATIGFVDGAVVKYIEERGLYR